MAYTEPVVALVLDHQQASTLLGHQPGFFDDENAPRWAGVEALQKMTGAPVESFSSEDESVYYVGIEVESGFIIDINPALLQKAAAIKSRYPHRLVQSAQLAVVSQFC